MTKQLSESSTSFDTPNVTATELKHFRVKANCEYCDGQYVFQLDAEASFLECKILGHIPEPDHVFDNPQKHCCDKCGNTKNFDKRFPYVTWVPV